jgi:alpha-beta hydrolase superfamily lysophospholipase
MPQGPDMAEPAFTLKGYRTGDGLRLPFFEWGPADPKAVVLALHGFGDYSNAFDKVAQALAKRGVATYAYDQRGFGVSPGRGRWHGAERLADDAAEAVGALKRKHPDVPLYLMGHSMGGGVALAAAARHPDLPVEGLILVAPAVWSRDFMPDFQKDLLRLSAHTLPWYPLTGQGIRIVPTDDLAALKALSRDPKVLRAFRVDQVWGLTNLMDLAADAPPGIGTRVLYLYGLRDDVIPLVPTKAALAGFSEPLLTAAIYDGGYHLLMRSKLGDAVIRDIAQWIEDPSAPLPSGADREWRERLDQR